MSTENSDNEAKNKDPNSETSGANAQEQPSVEDYKNKIDALQNKVDEHWNLYLRARADIENTHQRAKKDLENTHKYAVERFAKELLAVVDSLEHGLQVADSVKDKPYHEGMELTLKLFLDILEKFGVLALNPINETFDPTRMEAISMQVNSELEPNKVLIVAQKGFILNDRVLRPARVVVSKREEPDS